ncbi:hypothetical protein [Streptomyces sp. G45]|uniref:hypothetical protein n=1 Tax=Streptomyces sp. G45 TaxID=3406627 RepID=UPI003C18BAD3
MTPGRVRLGTKAASLARLAPVLTSARVLPLVHFTLTEWRADRAAVLDRVLAEPWSPGPLIVRSSGHGEDAANGSLAGRFRSVAGVRGRAALADAVDEVVRSYHCPLPRDQVLVQPELTRPVMSGVACSRHPATGAPYRVVSWVEGPGARTDGVTSGRGRALRTWYGAAGAPRAVAPGPRVAAVVELLWELEELTGVDALDVEFAVTRDEELILLQARPLAAPRRQPSAPAHHRHLARVSDAVARACRDQEDRCGRPALFGVMPDWNPAEIIGTHPRPLALSLYWRLITDRAWARARARYGYRDLRGVPLLVDFAGLPYVDVRASAASLVPADVAPATARWLVTHWTGELAQHPELHDKFETRAVLSCYAPGAHRRLADLVRHGLPRSGPGRWPAACAPSPRGWSRDPGGGGTWSSCAGWPRGSPARRRPARPTWPGASPCASSTAHCPSPGSRAPPSWPPTCSTAWSPRAPWSRTTGRPSCAA